MKTSRKTQQGLRWNGVLAFFIIGLFFSAPGAHAEFVYETPGEFVTSGYFNDDTNLDVLVLEKASGIARVGYQDGTGALTWSAPLVTGVENITGCAVGKFLQTDHDTLAVTSTDYNRVPLIDLSNANSATTSFIVTAPGIGAHTLVALPKPVVPSPSAFDALLVASAFNASPAEHLDLALFSPGPIISFAGPFNETGFFERGNPLQLAIDGPTYAAGIVRGDAADTLHVWQFTNSPGILAVVSNLPAGSDYVFGRFNNEADQRLLLYVPGKSNVVVRTLITSGAGLAFGPATTNSFPSAVKRLFFVPEETNGLVVISFENGVVSGLQVSAGAGGNLQVSAGFTIGPAGNELTALAPLGAGRFALLSGTSNSPVSLRAQVFTKNGSDYNETSSSSLPNVTARRNQATVWLFQSDPFTNTAAALISSISVPDWSSSVTGLPGSLSVRAENDAGTSSGLGNPAISNLGAPPAGTTYALPDQYRDDISFFSYSPPRPVEPVIITISPPPGAYGGPIQISFTKQNPAHQVFYRAGLANAWQLYSTPFQLTNDATIQYYGSISGSARGRLQLASYTMGRSDAPGSVPVTLPGSETNTPPTGTNYQQFSANGTVFYSRHSALAELDKFLGPSPYLGFSNSPFNNLGFEYFHLENFEDSALNTPGATASAGWIVATANGGGDSVDPGGRSYYSGGSQTNLTITFDAAALGGKLPTHAGIVWTDVGGVTSGQFGRGNVRFTARDANGVSLGTNIGVNLGDGSPNPAPGEDRFFGVVNAGGISSISITMTNSVDWEVDHLQYGFLNTAGFNDGIWSINLDGSGERFITDGARPRVSRDGQWMAFLRGGGTATSRGDLRVKNLSTGAETPFFINTDSIVGFDWNGDNELVFDNNCVLLRQPLDGLATQLPLALTPQCLNGAPVVNPVDNRLAFHNLNANAPGVYLTPPDWSSHSKVTEPNLLRLRWPAWSFDGSRLAMADRVSSDFINTGVNLWTAAADGSNLHQITAVSEPAGGFPHGAIWTPDGRALVGAGRIDGTNGLWVIILAADGSACHCPPRLLPTSAGSEIDFAGSIIVAPQEQIGSPGLFIRQERDAVVVTWTTNYAGYTLESQFPLSTNENWTPIPGPYVLTLARYEYREARATLTSEKFFRLRHANLLTTMPIIAQNEPDLRFHFSSTEAVVSWPASYAGYTLSVATNLSFPVNWVPVNTPVHFTNGVFEYRRSMPVPLQEFYRLHLPE